MTSKTRSERNQGQVEVGIPTSEKEEQVAYSKTIMGTIASKQWWLAFIIIMIITCVGVFIKGQNNKDQAVREVHQEQSSSTTSQVDNESEMVESSIESYKGTTTYGVGINKIKYDRENKIIAVAYGAGLVQVDDVKRFIMVASLIDDLKAKGVTDVSVLAGYQGNDGHMKSVMNYDVSAGMYTDVLSGYRDSIPHTRSILQ